MRCQWLLLTFFGVSLIFLASSFDAKIVRESEPKAGYIKYFDSEDKDENAGGEGNSKDADDYEEEQDDSEDDSEEVETTTNPSPQIEDVETDHPRHRLNATREHEVFVVAEGERLSMPCNVRLTPKAVVVWKKNGTDGSQLFSNSYPSVVKSEFYELDLDNNAALVITHVNQTDAGLYVCIVSDSDQGESVVTTHNVDVNRVSIAGAGKEYACLLPFLITFLAISLQ